MKYRVRELDGALLDAAVALADGNVRTGAMWWPIALTVNEFRPSVDWREGGPIIAREHIQLSNDWDGMDGGDPGVWTWRAYTLSTCWCEAETPLVAAMRQFVLSKLGEEVDL